MAGRKIVVGVTGGIAAYKSPELVRQLRRAGAEVRVVMSAGAESFITALTLQAVSGHPVRQAVLDPVGESGMDHISLARWADAILVAPATANFLAKLAAGMADDLLTTITLATQAPIAVAPAMNQQMWRATVTQGNVQRLRERGIHIWGPAEGEQACGESGPGRMVEPFHLVEQASRLFGEGLLAGVRVVVTAGPTREAIDPVRFISNHSSGRMGFAVAQAAAEEGAEVLLVSGPVTLATPHGVRRLDVESAEEMRRAVLEQPCDLFIGVAAVADYRPAAPADAKIKKGNGPLLLELVRNPDILAEVAALPSRPFTVGFAAETHSLEAHARQKLQGKRVDMIAANWVGQAAEGGGFNSDSNALQVIWHEGECLLPMAPKPELARKLVTLIANNYRNRSK